MLYTPVTAEFSYINFFPGSWAREIAWRRALASGLEGEDKERKMILSESNLKFKNKKLLVRSIPSTSEKLNVIGILHLRYRKRGMKDKKEAGN